MSLIQEKRNALLYIKFFNYLRRQMTNERISLFRVIFKCFHILRISCNEGNLKPGALKSNTVYLNLILTEGYK
jgi:hypothetical protein